MKTGRKENKKEKGEIMIGGDAQRGVKEKKCEEGKRENRRSSGRRWKTMSRRKLVEGTGQDPKRRPG